MTPMPIYGYRCTGCEREFEVVERMSDPPAGRCPDCGSPGRRLFYPAGIVFKGTGFYATDSRRSTGDGRAATPSTDAAAAEKGAGGEKGAVSEKGGGADVAASNGGKNATAGADRPGAGAEKPKSPRSTPASSAGDSAR